jgi:hypothetical protein
MQTDTITLSCTNNSGGFTCTTPAIFSGGDMFISFLLLVFLIMYIIQLVVKAVFYINYFKKQQAYFDPKILEKYKI